jgi:hypothetical protein
VSVQLGAYLVQVIGTAVLLIYGMPWHGRAPRNLFLAKAGAVVCALGAALLLITLLREHP